MIEPIHIEDETLLIHTFRAKDIARLPAMAADVFAILSDSKTLKYLPGKRLDSLADAEHLLKSAVLNFHAGRNYLHFISLKNTGEIIGLIDIITPDMAREYYKLHHYPHFIEFLLKADYSKKKVMTSVLPKFVKQAREQRIAKLAAVVNRENTGARKVLGVAGFTFQRAFDPFQDLYETIDQLN